MTIPPTTSSTSDPTSAPKRRIRFNPEISMGHLMQAVCIIFAVATAYFSIDKRVSILESVDPTQRLAAEKIVKTETRLQMMEGDLGRIENKLDRLIERQD